MPQNILKPEDIVARAQPGADSFETAIDEEYGWPKLVELMELETEGQNPNSYAKQQVILHFRSKAGHVVRVGPAFIYDSGFSAGFPVHVTPPEKQITMSFNEARQN